MRRLVAVVVPVALALGGCGDGEDRPGTVSKEGTGTGTGSVSGTGTGSATGTGAPAFSEAEADTVVEATLEDHRFVGIPASVRGRKVFFEATNKGPADHELEVLKEGGEAVGEIPAMAAGKSGTFAAELEPGRYTIQCLVEEGGKTHVELGMITTLTVE